MKLNEHKEYSIARINTLASEINRINELTNNSMCVYATGSYGRHEASKNSDIDLFFIDTDDSRPVSNLDKTIINAELIKVCRSMSFPEFSKDGMYLEVHSLKKIIENIGSTVDDYNNYFTARMLLLLESKPIYNKELHDKCLRSIVESYFVDFHDHSKNFKPLFLTNDIVRFWKTLCLNYEHRRKRKKKSVTDSKFDNKIVTHSKNLKLKFSRKLTCFSFIIKLISLKSGIDQEEVINISKMTPTERLESIKDTYPKISPNVQKALNSYQWFLNRTQIPSEKMLEWISDKEERDMAFEKSRSFGIELFDILESVDNQNLLNKLLI